MAGGPMTVMFLTKFAFYMLGIHKGFEENYRAYLAFMVKNLL